MARPGRVTGDNPQRFAFFCMAALELLPRIARSPRNTSAHDWHTALAPVYLRTIFAASSFHRGFRTVISIHNAGPRAITRRP